MQLEINKLFRIYSMSICTPRCITRDFSTAQSNTGCCFLKASPDSSLLSIRGLHDEYLTEARDVAATI